MPRTSARPNADITLARAIGRVVATVATTLAVVALGITMIAPWLLGGKSLVVETGSMRPAIAPGDLAVIRKVDSPGDLRIGDVITYQATTHDPDGLAVKHFVTHRIFALGASGSDVRITTQGDANSAPDEPISFADVRGKFWYAVPGVGRAATWFAQHKLLLLGAAGGVWAASALVDARRRRREAPRATAAEPHPQTLVAAPPP